MFETINVSDVATFECINGLFILWWKIETDTL